MTMFCDDPHHPSVSGPRGTRVFRGACVVLAMAVLAQGAAVGMAWRDRGAAGRALVHSGKKGAHEGPEASAGSPETPAGARGMDPFDPEGGVPVDPHPEMAGPAGEDPLLPDPADGSVPAAPAAIAVAAPLDVPISDEACLQFLDEGVYLRQRGDMQGALKELRQAQAILPDHPKLVYQVALTLDQMGLEHRAAEFWRKLRLLGPGAGNYYQLAAERLKEGGMIPPPGAGEGEETHGEDREGRFVVSGISVERLPQADGGETVVVMGKITRRQPEPADVEQLGLKLHLFDEVNGQRVDRAFGADPPISWPDAPVDWAEGSERFVFTFTRQAFTPEEVVRMGQRKYYGYAIELRYGGSGQFTDMKLQDLRAEPAFLADLASEIPEGGPRIPAPGAEGGPEPFDVQQPLLNPGDQPGAVLFPGDRVSGH